MGSGRWSGGREGGITGGCRMAIEVSGLVRSAERDPAQGPAVVRSTRHGQDTAGEGGGSRERVQLHQRERSRASEQVRRRVGKGGTRGLSNGKTGLALHHI